MSRILLVMLAVLFTEPLAAAPWQSFTALAISVDGRFLSTGGLGGEVLYWEVSTGEVLGKWQLASRAVAGVAFDASGNNLAAVLVDGSACVLSAADEAIRSLTLPAAAWPSLTSAAVRWRTVAPPMSGVSAPASDRAARGFPDGRIVVTGPEGELSWQAHLGAVTGLVWSPDGRSLVSCSYDGSLAQWDSRTGKLLSRL